MSKGIGYEIISENLSMLSDMELGMIEGAICYIMQVRRKAENLENYKAEQTKGIIYIKHMQAMEVSQ